MIDLLKRFAGPYRRLFVLGPASKLIEVVFDLLTPVVVAWMIDQGVGQHSVHNILMGGVILAGMALAGFAFTLVCQKMASLASQGMGTDIRSALFAHINEFSYAELDHFGTPTLITRLINDVNQIQLAVALGIRQLVRFPLLAIGSMVAALLIDVELGLIFWIATPLVGLVFWLVIRRSIPLFKQVQERLDVVGRIAREGLSGARVVRAFVKEDFERSRFEQAAEEQAATSIEAGRLSSLLNPATLLIMNVAICAILWTGGVRVQIGALTQGQIVAFVNYMMQTLLAIVYVANLAVVFTKASASAGRIIEILDREPSIKHTKDERFTLDASGIGVNTVSQTTVESALAIRLRDVSYTFSGAAAPALQEITLDVPAGATLGIIGGTGAGKSTLINLMPRLYDASSGAVEALGCNARDWNIEELRHSVGLVPQQAQLVSGSIRSNLQWRQADASDEELWQALETAQAADFVCALPAGLDAPVEAGGKNFSGGQRQRLTIARALVGNPPILIMDDSSSALDAKTDAALRLSIAKTRASLTNVIVSQRVASVRDADAICVLYHGKIAGMGTHDELLKTCNIYREIAQSQLSGEQPQQSTEQSQLLGEVSTHA